MYTYINIIYKLTGINNGEEPLPLTSRIFMQSQYIISYTFSAVTVQDQTVAVNMFKEIGYFFRPGVFRTQVNVRKHNGRIIFS